MNPPHDVTSMNRNWSDVSRFIESIPVNNCSPPQAEFLYRLSRDMKGVGEIVEIGTNVGKSTMALAYGQKEKAGRAIHTIDIYEHPAVADNLNAAGVAEYVNRCVEPSAIAVRTWDRPIELLFCDGDHSYVGLTYDIKMWAPFVVEGGYIVMHDYPRYKTHQLWKAVHRTLLSKPDNWRVVSDRDAGSLLVLQRIALERECSKMPSGIVQRLYRNLRSVAFCMLPNMSKRIVRMVMSKRHAGKAR